MATAVIGSSLVGGLLLGAVFGDIVCVEGRVPECQPSFNAGAAAYGPLVGVAAGAFWAGFVEGSDGMKLVFFGFLMAFLAAMLIFHPLA